MDVEQTQQREIKTARRFLAAGRLVLGVLIPPFVALLVMTAVSTYQFYVHPADPDSWFRPDFVFFFGLMFVYFMVGIQSIVCSIAMEFIGRRIFRLQNRITENQIINYAIWGVNFGLLVGLSGDMFNIRNFDMFYTYIGGIAGLLTTPIFIGLWSLEFHAIRKIENPELQIKHRLPYETANQI